MLPPLPQSAPSPAVPAGRPRRRRSPSGPLRFVTFLAPNMLGVYQYIARHVGALLGVPTQLAVGRGYEEIHSADVAFVCGLPYVALTRRPDPPVEPLAAPVLCGERYAGRPVYFSDVVVRRESPYQSFADLRGKTWAYNEPLSQSGYGITRHRLLELGETRGFFGRVREAGWHEVALRWVCEGRADAAAIDTHVLAVAGRDYPELASRLRVIDTLGPSPIQPVVAARRLPRSLKHQIRAALVGLADHAAGRAALAHGFIERFVPVNDATYDPIRAMVHAAEAADFLTIR